MIANIAWNAACRIRNSYWVFNPTLFVGEEYTGLLWINIDGRSNIYLHRSYLSFLAGLLQVKGPADPTASVINHYSDMDLWYFLLKNKNHRVSN